MRDFSPKAPKALRETWQGARSGPLYLFALSLFVVSGGDFEGIPTGQLSTASAASAVRETETGERFTSWFSPPCTEEVKSYFEIKIVMHKYFASLYFSVYTMTGIGFGDISATTHNEVVLATLQMLCGAVFWAYMIGQFVTLVSHMDVYGNAFKQRMDELNYMMVEKRYPTELQRRCRMYLLNSKMHQRQTNYRQLEKTMSIALRTEVASANNTWVVRVWYLRSASAALVADLSQATTPFASPPRAAQIEFFFYTPFSKKTFLVFFFFEFSNLVLCALFIKNGGGETPSDSLSRYISEGVRADGGDRPRAHVVRDFARDRGAARAHSLDGRRLGLGLHARERPVSFRDHLSSLEWPLDTMWSSNVTRRGSPRVVRFSKSRRAAEKLLSSRRVFFCENENRRTLTSWTWCARRRSRTWRSSRSRARK